MTVARYYALPPVPGAGRGWRILSALLLAAGLSLSVSADPACRVNVNAATPAELEALPKVGPVLAGRIIEARQLADVAALDSVKGIGPKVLDGLKPFVAFDGATDTTSCAELVKASKPAGT